MMTLVIVLGVLFFISIILNIVLVWYSQTTLSKIDAVYTASEAASEIFSMIDAYEEHLHSVHEKPTFYGDETLQGLIEHTKEMMEYLKGYENIYSFTQPDLEQQLLSASTDMENYDQEETEKEQGQ